MKTKLFFVMVLFFSLLGSEVCAQDACTTSHVDGAISAGYVFKRDHLFQQIYGSGMVNAFTIDLSYHNCSEWGVGGRFSYWVARGRTPFFQRHTLLQEVPITLYIRRMFHVRHCLQLHLSLGGGVAWMHEDSYLGHIDQYKGIGEAEIGLNYPLSNCAHITTAFRYLFPRQHQSTGFPKADIGGFDIRAGLSYAF